MKEVDVVDHILLDCPLLFDTLVWIFNWCDILFQIFLSISDFVNFAATRGNYPKERKIFLAICYAYLRCVWKARNGVWFNRLQVNSSKLADNVISFIFNLMKRKGNFDNYK
uniref:Reverse transcriptase zinc-binding domain-containing protein n=1 Tax=Lactuca sativa TaxID=4236 RepID=A0A9R1VAB8_LACSA|nr:hypothetical protein LSAT_V11C600325370 [Lactuca sativa]